jgi:uncharacterized protein (DUF1015 family)
MVRVFPFEGILYNKKLLKKLDKVFAPPYDVISPEEQDQFYNAHDFNYIRLILGKDFPGDTDYNNRYVRAAAFLDGWLRHQVLIKDEKPAFYAYEQRFTVNGKKYSRIGFIGLLRLEDMGRGKVFPHEETHSKAKIDRLQIMRATFSNLECIFSLYSDEKNRVNKILKRVMSRKPYIEVTDKDRVTHRLWRVEKKSAIGAIIKEMRDKPAFIADGHHRYEAAIRFKNELKTKNTKFSEDESYNHIMMYFTPIEDKGLVVFPIHRVLHKLNYFEPVHFEKDLERFFEVKQFKANKKDEAKMAKKLLNLMAKAQPAQHLFTMYLGNGHFALLSLKDEELVEELVAEEKPKAWKRLDTTILHYTVFDNILNIALEIEEKVIYVKDPLAALKLVDEKKAQVAFLLNPTKIEEITTIASKLEKMPQKSTYFWPKLLSGLVLNKIVHGEKVKL